MNTYKCNCCGKEVKVFEVPSMFEGRPNNKMIHCETDKCPNWKMTKDLRDDVSQWYSLIKC
jgi:hypothetical protein